MQHLNFDGIVRSLAASGSRRKAILAGAAALLVTDFEIVPGKSRRTSSSVLDKRRKRAEKRGENARNKKSKDGRASGKKGKESFSKNCRRFVVSAGPDPNDRFEHIDDDVLIELIPKGKKGVPTVLLRDDNNAPNGPNGDHPRATPFTAKVGDSIHIVARNEVVGGCELDEVWIHCTEGRGGKVKLTDAVTPEECSRNASKVGVFFDETVRITNR